MIVMTITAKRCDLQADFDAAPALIDVFRLRAEMCARLAASGEMELIEAVDRLQDTAVAYKLVDEIGQDAVQAIIVAAFGTASSEPEQLVRAEQRSQPSDRGAAQSTVDALMYSLRSGVGVLSRSDVRQRLAALNEKQLRDVCTALQNRKVAKSWTAADVEKLIETWMASHG